LCILVQDEITINVGALGDLLFEKGYYLYIGSAMGHSGSSTLLNRVKRHISPSSHKKVHWHIDYLLKNTNNLITLIYLIPSSQRLECEIARAISIISESSIKNFGSSDCDCDSHLFYFKKFSSFKEFF